ncbi:uncharacterized protein [Rutidosis leptorrhynchoides]|uniref:uncharacterized protein n=1 Tax=Rutidosis leptorrhynchoides TaxID=125765 RepID=UPI003A99DCCE
MELEEQEKEHEPMDSSSSSSLSRKVKQETNFNIPMGGIQIKTKRSRLMDTTDVSSECSSSSPSTKTPSLVARLMGLDLLPENSSPRTSLSSPRPSSSSSSHKLIARSLPVTPRASTGSRTTSAEVDYHHRHSLQGNKENRRRFDENTSEYAKQIAKQVRENISRRVGADITNTPNKKEQRRDELLVVLKPKRPTHLDEGYGGGKENEPCSPRLRLLEIKNNLNKPTSNSPKCSPLSTCSTEVVKSQLVKEEITVVKQEISKKVELKCKKIANEKYDLRLKKINQREELKCTKKCNNMKKSTPLSNHLVNVNTSTKFISFKKDITSPSSTLSQKQVTIESITQLPSCQSQSYNTILNHKPNDVIFNSDGVTINGVTSSDYFDYISKILNYTGIESTTKISITHWYSPSHPLHPTILEKVNNTVVNWKLMFDVTNELLVEILKPYLRFKPWVFDQQKSNRMYGSELITKLSKKIQSFPAKDCQVLEDIDELIEGDMRSSTRGIGEIAFDEESEELVAEIERDMVDTLVGEMAVSGMMKRHVGFAC